MVLYLFVNFFPKRFKLDFHISFILIAEQIMEFCFLGELEFEFCFKFDVFVEVQGFFGGVLIFPNLGEHFSIF